MLEAALAYAARGIPVFPCEKNKRPLVGGGHKTATTDVGQIAKWWSKREFPLAMIGVPTGRASGIDVLDIDAKNGRDGFTSVPRWRDLSPVIVRTPSGGVHLYFRSSGTMRNSASKLAPGLDVRGDGGYVIVPPSFNKGDYHFEKGGIEDFDRLPRWPDDLSTTDTRSPSLQDAEKHPTLPEKDESPQAAGTLAEACAQMEAAEEGTRNDTLNRVAYAVGRLVGAGQLDQVTATARLTEAASKTGLEAAEIEHTIGSGITAGMSVLDRDDPMHSARTIVKATYLTATGHRFVHRHRGTFWRWDGSCYRIVDDETQRATIWRFLEAARTRSAEGKIVPFKPKLDRVNNVFAALVAICQLDGSVEPPVWLSDERKPPPSEFFAARNGLLHLPTQTLHAPTPDYFGVSASEVVFDNAAPVPRKWLAFLDQVLGDAEAIQAMQEWFGYTLAPDTSQQKILFCVGPRRSGKGTVARVLTALLGRASVAGPTMSSLAENFGLAPLITKPLAIISDARIGQRTNKMAIVERLLSISGEDTMTVDRKYLSSWTGKLPTRFSIMTNELPSLTEGSGALTGRFVTVVFQQSFYGNEDTGLTDKLLVELPGILNWALEGYKRLRERGRFVQPANAQDEIEAMEMLSSPVKAFVRDKCIVATGQRVPVDDLFEAFQWWCQDEEGRDAGSKEWFSRNLRSAVPGVRVSRPGVDGVRIRMYEGIALIQQPGLNTNIRIRSTRS